MFWCWVSNIINLPKYLLFKQEGETAGDVIEYKYDAAGVKHAKLVKPKGSASQQYTYYIGNHIYNDSKDLLYIITDEGRIVFNSNGTKDYEYNLKDHLGNVRVVFSQSGSVIQENSYYPFGMQQKAYSYNLTPSVGFKDRNEYLYNGKELQDGEFVDSNGERYGLGWMDYGARMYDAQLGRWHVVDPLAEKYLSLSPYNYVANNPMTYIDPDGMQIVGVTKEDANKVYKDLMSMFSGEKFEKFRSLITLNTKGTTFNSIDGDALKTALDGADLNEDQQSLVDQVTGAINSKDVHKVEFVEASESASKDFTTAFKDHLNSKQAGVGDMMVPGSKMSGTLLKGIAGSGMNVPTKKGSHSVILEGDGITHDGGRAVTTGHEVIGHGVASAAGVSSQANNTRAIRVDNLIRRVMGIKKYRDGSNHAGGKVTNPYARPEVIKQ